MFFPSPRQAYVSYSATSNKKLLGAPGIATRNKKLLGAPGLTTRSKDATNGAPHICAAYVFVGSSGHSALLSGALLLSLRWVLCLLHHC